MFADLPSSELPQPLITAWQTGHLAVLWAATPFELVNERANLRLTANQWQEVARSLPTLEPQLGTLPPVPILSLDPTSRLQDHLRSAGLYVAVIQSREDVPPQGVHVYYRLAGDLASRQGLVLSRQEIQNLLSDYTKRLWIWEPWRKVAEQGAALVLGADPQHPTFQAWWERLGPELQGYQVFAVGDLQARWPQQIAPVAARWTDLQASLASVKPAVATPAEPLREASTQVPAPHGFPEARPPSEKLILEVFPTTVKLTFREVEYTAPNRIDKEALLMASGDPQRYGELLFDSIIHRTQSPGGLATRTTWDGYTMARNLIQQGALRVELRLDPNDPGLHAHHWETLKLQSDELPLALQAGFPFYRYVAGEADHLKIESRPLGILAAISNPTSLQEPGHAILEKLDKLDVPLEREILEQSFAKIPGARYDILDREHDLPVTLRGIHQALQQGYHVLHLVCHGAVIDARRGKEVYLILEKRDGQAEFASAADLRRLLNGTQLRLVVLVACRSALSSQRETLRGLGPSLVQAGIPAVIAMQDDLPIPAARRFNRAFYQQLARSGQVDMALAATRISMLWYEREEGGPSGTWAIPALFLSTRDGGLFDPGGNQTTEPAAAQPDSAVDPTEPAVTPPADQEAAKPVATRGTLTTTQRLHRQTQLEELQARHQRLSRRIRALGQDVDQALSQEQKDIFLERKAEREAERDEVARQMAEIERELQG